MMMRWTQGLIHESQHRAGDSWAPGRGQLYVDDPAIVAWGAPETRGISFSLAILWWLVLGVPLSWKKGAVYGGTVPHTWIGVDFCCPSPGVGRMWLPRPFVIELIRLCKAFLSVNFLPVGSADALVGRAGRVAHVLDHTRPWVSSLYRALAESLRALEARAREAPPKMVACRRFRHGARQLLRVLRFNDRHAPVPNSKDILATTLPPPDPATHRMEIDASPWGGGGILFEDNVATRYFACTWSPTDFEGRNVVIGSSAAQTFFETLVMILALELWGQTLHPTVVLGDSTAALQEALSLRGKGLQEDVAQALSVLVVSRSLSISVGHLPAEANLEADTLSRLAEPKGGYANPFAQRPWVIRDTPVTPSTLWAWIR